MIGTVLPVDQLNALHIVGRNFQKAQTLASERVVKVERNGDTINILFQSREFDCVAHRLVMLKRVENLDGEYWQYDNELTFSVPAPKQSRTGVASEMLTLTHEKLPEVRTGWEKPDECQPSKMPLDAQVIAKALNKLVATQHDWYLKRLVRDHGETVGKAAFKAGMAQYIANLRED